MNLIIFSQKSSWYSKNRLAETIQDFGAKTPVVNQGQTSFNLKANSTTWVRASRSRMFLVNEKSGSEVQKGNVLGTICQVNSNKKTSIRAPRNGMIIGHNNSPVINQGDALFHLAYKKK